MKFWLWSVKFVLSLVLIECSDVYFICDPIEDEPIEYSTQYCTISNLYAEHTDNLICTRSDRAETEIVKFSAVKCPNIPADFFLCYPQVRHFDMSFSELEVIHRDFTNAYELLYLTLSNNKLTELSSSIFSGAPNLTFIDLSSNQIEKVHNYSFAGLEKLSKLVLSNNRLVSLEQMTFSRLFQLEEILLDDNQLEVVHPELFADCHMVQKIRLNNNRLTQFDEKLLQQMKYLSLLDLSNNRLTQFVSSNFETPRLELKVNNNEVKTIDLFNVYIIEAVNNSVSTLKINDTSGIIHLAVANNSITDLSNLLRQFRSLTYLDVSHNYVGTLNISTLSELRSLQKLYLRNCSIGNINHGTFYGQTELIALDISYNNLRHIDFDTFSPTLKNLEQLFIDGNNLTSIEALSKLSFPRLTTLGLSNNNFKCNYLNSALRHLELHELEFTVDFTQLGHNTTHVLGILCDHTPDEHVDILDKVPYHSVDDHYDVIGHNRSLYELTLLHKLMAHSWEEERREFYLSFLRYLTACIVAIGVSIVAIKFAVLRKRRMSQLEFFSRQRIWQSASYRSTATISTETA